MFSKSIHLLFFIFLINTTIIAQEPLPLTWQNIFTKNYGARQAVLSPDGSKVAITANTPTQGGIFKNLETNFWPGHTIVTYPFYDELKKNIDNKGLISEITQKKIERVNLYIHIPYCTGICSYCAYSKTATKNIKRKEDYIKAMVKELTFWESLADKNIIKVDSIYFGGGTPTELPSYLIDRIIQHVKKISNWNKEIEVTCEGSPETLLGKIGKNKLEILKENNVNRISIGVQSFDDLVSKNTKRRHTRNEAIKSIEQIRSVGFQNFNIDLIYGLPLQTIDSWLNSLELAVQLEIPSITLYPFKLKRKSNWSRTFNETNKPSNWSQDNILLLSHIGKLYLESNGYIQNTVYWFVKDSSKIFKQQNIKYKMNNLLGIGCSTYSYLNECQFFNIYNELRYNESIENTTNAIELGRKLTINEIMTRFIIFWIKRGFSINEFQNKFKISVFDEFNILENI